MSLRDEIVAGGRELDKLLQNLPVNVEKNILRAALREGAKVFKQEVGHRIPRDTGQLAASLRITTRYKKGQVSASVKVGNWAAWYAHLVEFGTRPHYITVTDGDRGAGRGKGRKGTANRRETLASMGVVNRRVLQIGANFVGPSVHHPGFAPKPFMRPAADAGFAAAVQAVRLKIRQRLTKEGLTVPAPIPSDPTT